MNPFVNCIVKKSILITTVLLAFLIFQSCKKDPFEANSGSFTDKRDGHVYEWVKIGGQIWMAENLAYAPYVCAPDSQCGIWVYGYSGTGAYGDNYYTYGCLYDWETANKVCPEGWHLPSDEEWKKMEKFIGMKDYQLDIFGNRGGDINIGGQIASTDSYHWDDVFIRTNKTGFSAIPGGERNIWYNEGEYYFKSKNSAAVFWTNTERDEIFAISRNIAAGYIDRLSSYKDAGFSVRCIKN